VKVFGFLRMDRLTDGSLTKCLDALLTGWLKYWKIVRGLEL